MLWGIVQKLDYPQSALMTLSLQQVCYSFGFGEGFHHRLDKESFFDWYLRLLPPMLNKVEQIQPPPARMPPAGAASLQALARRLDHRCEIDWAEPTTGWVNQRFKGWKKHSHAEQIQMKYCCIKERKSAFAIEIQSGSFGKRAFRFLVVLRLQI